MVITGVNHIDADPEKNVKEDYCVVKGFAFDFKGTLLPVEYTIKNQAGMKYFEDLDANSSNPVYTQVWGKINCSSEKVEIVEESAFGENSVTTREKKVKEWNITGTAKNLYDFGDEEVLTAEELKKGLQDREIYLAEIKKRSEDYKASKGITATAKVATKTSATPKAKETHLLIFN